MTIPKHLPPSGHKPEEGADPAAKPGQPKPGSAETREGSQDAFRPADQSRNPILDPKSVSGTLPKPFASYPFGPLLDGRLWDAEGESGQVNIGAQTLSAVSLGKNELGRDILRFQAPDGSLQIYGLLHKGKPVRLVLRQGYESWEVDLQFYKPLILPDFRNALSQKPTSETWSFQGGAIVERSQFPVQPSGLQVNGLHHQGRLFAVLSDKKLETNRLQSIAAVISDSPLKSFNYLTGQGGTGQIYVFEEIGERRYSNGQVEPILGVHGKHYSEQGPTGGGDLVVVSKHLDSLAETTHVFGHEAGHHLDYSNIPHLSKSILSPFGGLLFGSGNKSNFKAGSDFVSQYAATHPGEDFAETHRFFLDQWRAYKQQASGQDLLNLSPEAFSRHLKRGAGPLLEAKIMAIFSAYK